MKLEYDYQTSTGKCYIPFAGMSSDMDAQVRFFKRIDPRVKTILMFGGGRLEITYRRMPGNKWVALQPKEESSTPAFQA